MRTITVEESGRIRGGERILLVPGEAGLISLTGEGIVFERILLGEGMPPSLVGLTVEVPAIDCGCEVQGASPSIALPRRR